MESETRASEPSPLKPIVVFGVLGLVLALRLAPDGELKGPGGVGSKVALWYLCHIT
jgi:hypothetical protein